MSMYIFKTEGEISKGNMFKRFCYCYIHKILPHRFILFDTKAKL